MAELTIHNFAEKEKEMPHTTLNDLFNAINLAISTMFESPPFFHKDCIHNWPSSAVACSHNLGSIAEKLDRVLRKMHSRHSSNYNLFGHSTNHGLRIQGLGELVSCMQHLEYANIDDKFRSPLRTLQKHYHLLRSAYDYLITDNKWTSAEGADCIFDDLYPTPEWIVIMANKRKQTNADTLMRFIASWFGDREDITFSDEIRNANGIGYYHSPFMFCFVKRAKSQELLLKYGIKYTEELPRVNTRKRSFRAIKRDAIMNKKIKK